jgi:crotonobetainyl-CoA:carnitine CoA-transferase CaiB-like acyl-CoA transferase
MLLLSPEKEIACDRLKDVRVLAIEQYGAKPFGTVHLADMGADII